MKTGTGITFAGLLAFWLWCPASPGEAQLPLRCGPFTQDAP